MMYHLVDMRVIAVLVFPLLRCSLSTALSNTMALNYLFRYGYMAPSGGNYSDLIDGNSYSNAIADFQAFVGLEVTGKLDLHTHNMMMLPRCGVKDVMGTGENRAKRFTLEGSKWSTKDLNYKIFNYPKHLAHSEVDRAIQKAFNVWTRYTDLTFTPKSGRVHIKVLFHIGKYGDDIKPFDGPSGTLAHAYLPSGGGAIHFDAAETWTINFKEGGRSIHLFQVAAHEIGHSLGLYHSKVEEALMAPIYKQTQFLDLSTDDIEGIQQLYGKKTMKSKLRYPQKPIEPSPSAGESLCDVSEFDTIFKSAEGQTYVFKGDNYWKITKFRVESGYPKRISDNWIGLPGNIDASFTHKNGKTYFFKGSKYWRYNGTKVDGLYPKEIFWLFPGVPSDLDAAMVWYGKIYFFKGSQYWRFISKRNAKPQPLSDWSGVPNNLNAAFQTVKGSTYFFKDDAYYSFNEVTFAVRDTTPSFPRSSAYWWFGCKDAPSGTIKTN